MPKNIYGDVDSWERRFNYDVDLGAPDVTELLKLMEESARDIDDYCRTHFYSEVATLTFDGSGDDFLEIPDLASLTTLVFDEDGDLTYEETVNVVTDVFLMRPFHDRPYDALPRRRIVIDPNGTYTRFPVTERGVKIGAIWGFGNDVADTSTTVSGAHNDSVKVINVVDGTKLHAGQTMVIGSEQFPVDSIATNAVTVGERGLNGTTAVALVGGETVNVRKFPEKIVGASYIQSSRKWRRNQIGNIDRRSDRPQRSWHANLDDDVVREIAEFARYDA